MMHSIHLAGPHFDEAPAHNNLQARVVWHVVQHNLLEPLLAFAMQHPYHLGTPLAILIAAAGATAIYINWDSDHQRQVGLQQHDHLAADERHLATNKLACSWLLKCADQHISRCSGLSTGQVQSSQRCCRFRCFGQPGARRSCGAQSRARSQRTTPRPMARRKRRCCWLQARRSTNALGSLELCATFCRLLMRLGWPFEMPADQALQVLCSVLRLSLNHHTHAQGGGGCRGISTTCQRSRRRSCGQCLAASLTCCRTFMSSSSPCC